MEICKDCDREDDNDDYICSAKDLPRVFAILFQNLVAVLCNVFGLGVSVKIEIVQKGAFVEAFEDFIGEIVVADGQSVRNDVFLELTLKSPSIPFNSSPVPALRSGVPESR